MYMKIGIECEGIYSGTKTLFVASAFIEASEIIKTAKEHNCTNIYLGADYSEASMEQALAVRKNWHHLLTVEIPVTVLKTWRKSTLYENINFIVRINAEIDDLGKFDQIKVESSSKCYLAPVTSFIINEKNYLDTKLD